MNSRLFCDKPPVPALIRARHIYIRPGGRGDGGVNASATKRTSQQDSYELFRRAIVERDEQAWIDSAARYRPLLAAWASRCSASAALTESYDDLADQAFARAWSALSPERFASFPTLAALLAYMRACVTTTVIDHARSELSRERMEQAIQA